MVKIKNIIPNSTAAQAGLNSGDIICSINGEKIDDYIDYLYQISEAFIDLEIKTKSGENKLISLERKAGEVLGIEFKEIIFDGLKQCKNNCIFCFVKQQPQNMRNSLNQMDDDYRFSFLQGSFVTLTNLKKDEIKRIIDKNLSPINISVHTTNPELRVKMMKNPEAAKINKLLKLFKKNMIEFHTQIVLCPGYNDKKELDRTLADLFKLYPQILSIGIVPVGLTKHRDGLEDIRTLNQDEMTTALEQIKYWQQKAEAEYGENFIYAADEFYLNSDYKMPDYSEYNNFPQLENGIGLTALMNENIRNINFPKILDKAKNILIISSELGEKALKNLISELNKITNLEYKVKKIKNKFFGDTVTVAGLLTAQDIRNAILKFSDTDYDHIFIPKLVLNDQAKFLDDITKKEFLKELKNYDIHFVKDLKEIVEVIKDG